MEPYLKTPFTLKHFHAYLRRNKDPSKPLEAFFVDLHVGEHGHEEEAYHEDNMHPSVEEALQSTKASEWKEAMCIEIGALKKNKPG